MSFFTVIEHDTPNFILHFFGRRVAGETHGRQVQKSLLFNVQILILQMQVLRLQRRPDSASSSALRVDVYVSMFISELRSAQLRFSVVRQAKDVVASYFKYLSLVRLYVFRCASIGSD